MVFRSLARDSAIYGGADLASKAVVFLTFPLIAAAISPSAFGALELMLTATALLGIATNCGLNNALHRYYWDPQIAPEQRPTLVSSGLVAQAAFLLIAVVLALLMLTVYGRQLSEWLAPLGLIGMLAALVLMVANQLVQYLLDVIRLQMAPWRFFGVAMVSRVLTAIAGVMAVTWLALGLNGLVAAQALMALLAVPLALYAVRRDLQWRFDPQLARLLVRFGHPFIYTGLAFWLFGAMDRWLLAAMATVEEVGIYSVAFRFATVMLFVSMAFGQAWSPVAVKVRTDHPQAYRHIYVDVLLALCSGMLIFGAAIALFSVEVIDTLMPEEYRGAALPLSALALGLVLQASMQVTALGISLSNKPQLFAKLSWLAAGLNLLLNLLMIPSMGAFGAAVATSLSYLFLTSSYAYYTQRLHPLPMPWRKLLVLAALWLVLAGCLIGLWHGHPMATSLVWRSLLMLICLLTCASLIPWRRVLHKGP
jgi:O-antigen/teichoic acid export membrane protein